MSHVYNPLTNQFDPSHPPFVGAEGPFCSGHTWVLDELGNSKLLAVGGWNYPANHGSEKAYWFDPQGLAWNGDPVDLPTGDGNWYPGLVTYGDDVLRKLVIAAVGGSPDFGEVPDVPNVANPVCPPQFGKWWTLQWPFKVLSFPPMNPSWESRTNAASYLWHQYPRPLLLSQGYLLSSGHVVICEDTMVSLAATMNWGGNPAQVIDLAGSQHLTPIGSLDPNTLTPAGGHQDVFGWNYNNVVLQHTLRPNWAWTTDPAVALTRYDLDRVIAFGGVPKLNPLHSAPGVLLNHPAHQLVLELQGASSSPPTGWSWVEKARPQFRRVHSNFVLLPDGTVLLVGGGQMSHGSFVRATELFDPQGPPPAMGTWQTLQDRPLDPDNLKEVPRQYHSVALLLPGGEVAIMGGVDQVPQNYAESMHTIELFKPPYWYFSQRPSLTNVPSVIRYPTVLAPNTFCVQTGAPNCILRACLIGIGSVTHQFDYGQRYVELMVRETSCGGGNIEILPPPKPSMAPPGYYILFLVDVNNLPSPGVFVKLDY